MPKSETRETSNTSIVAAVTRKNRRRKQQTMTTEHTMKDKRTRYSENTRET